VQNLASIFDSSRLSGVVFQKLCNICAN